MLPPVANWFKLEYQQARRDAPGGSGSLRTLLDGCFLLRIKEIWAESDIKLPRARDFAGTVRKKDRNGGNTLSLSRNYFHFEKKKKKVVLNFVQ